MAKRVEQYDIYITTTEYGKLLDPPITSRRVRLLCEQGRLDCFKVGQAWVVHKDSPDPRRKYERPKPTEKEENLPEDTLRPENASRYKQED